MSGDKKITSDWRFDFTSIVRLHYGVIISTGLWGLLGTGLPNNPHVDWLFTLNLLNLMILFLLRQHPKRQLHDINALLPATGTAAA